jgi:hypothetical protein
VCVWLPAVVVVLLVSSVVLENDGGVIAQPMD